MPECELEEIKGVIRLSKLKTLVANACGYSSKEVIFKRTIYYQNEFWLKGYIKEHSKIDCSEIVK